MRCLNCGKNGIPLKTEICPQCGVHIPSLNRDLLAPGTMLDNKYRIDYPLGRGGFGITYRAMHTFTEQILAIKEFYPREHALRDTTTGNLTILAASKDAYDRAKQRFLREGKTLAKLNHPNIVRVQDFFLERGTAYLVMEFVNGSTLKEEIDRQSQKQFSATRVKEIIAPVISALAAAHASEIYHLDIKPDNILIAETGRIVLIDFGASRVGLSSGTTQAFTIDYAPPEVISGTQVGSYSDIFELAMMVYEMLQGKKPPNALDRLLKDNLSVTELPASFISLISSGLQLSAENRPNNIKKWWDGSAETIEKAPPETVIKSINSQNNNIYVGSQSNNNSKSEVTTKQVLKPASILAGLAGLGIIIGGVNYYNLSNAPIIKTDNIKPKENAIEDIETEKPLNKEDAQKYYKLGVEDYEAENYDRAVQNFTKAIENNPDYFEAYNYRGITYDELQEAQKALADYNKAIEINPNYALGYYNRALANANLGNNQKAIQDYTKAIEIDPNYADAYNNRGNVYYSLGDKQKALADYNKALEINSNYALAYYNRGLVYDNWGDKQRALQEYNKAIENDPNYERAYYSRALIYHNMKDLEKALADYNKAIQINPQYSYAYNNRGNIYYERGDKEKAFADYNKAIAVNNNNSLAYYNRANVYRTWNDNQKALSDYNKALKINPNYADAYYNRGLSYVNLGQIENAISSWEEAAKIYQKQDQIDNYQRTLNLIGQYQ